MSTKARGDEKEMMRKRIREGFFWKDSCALDFVSILECYFEHCFVGMRLGKIKAFTYYVINLSLAQKNAILFYICCVSQEYTDNEACREGTNRFENC